MLASIIVYKLTVLEFTAVNISEQIIKSSIDEITIIVDNNSKEVDFKAPEAAIHMDLSTLLNDCKLLSVSRHYHQAAKRHR